MDEKLLHVLERFKPSRFHYTGSHTLPFHCYMRPSSALNNNNNNISVITRNGSSEATPTYPHSVFPLLDLCRHFNITGQKWTDESVVNDCLREEVSSHRTSTNELYSNNIYRHGHVVRQSKQPEIKKCNARFKHGNVDICDTSIISMFSFSGPATDTFNLRKSIPENPDSKLPLNKNVRELDWIIDDSTSEPSCEKEMGEINPETEMLNTQLSIMDQNQVMTVGKLHTYSNTLNSKVAVSSDVNGLGSISVFESRDIGTIGVNVKDADAISKPCSGIVNTGTNLLSVRTMN